MPESSAWSCGVLRAVLLAAATATMATARTAGTTTTATTMRTSCGWKAQHEGRKSINPQDRQRAPSRCLEGGIYIPPVSPGRKIAMTVGRVLTGVLAFLVVVVIVLLVVYFLDQAMGWGLVGVLGA